MSVSYLAAAAELDVAIGTLASLTERSTLMVVADHGGRGGAAHDHCTPHPENDTIPLVFAGPGVRRGHIVARPTSLLDLPPTVLWYFGAPIPECYGGRPLEEVFQRTAKPIGR
jgi:arylsulfatase A-like enzyme